MKSQHGTPKPRRAKGLRILRLNAAGIDIGSREIYVALPPDRAAQTVRSFGSVTEELEAIGSWLHQHGITTVAMESTSIYWIPLCRVLDNAGIEVFLVNAREVKHVPGRKTDVLDCQWLQQLHSVGLLRASFRPAQEIDAIRCLQRHREGLVKARTTQIHLMQKAMRLMNVQLETAVSDITGETGMTIIRAIVAGEHDPHRLAALRDPRCKNSQEDIAKALHGTYTPEQLFALRQTFSLFDTYTVLIAACDKELLQHYEDFAKRQPPPPTPLPPRRPSHKKISPLDGQIRIQLFQMAGVDLTQIDGIGLSAAQSIIAHIGVDMTPWKNAKHFCSWMGVAPQNDTSAGKTLRTGTKKVTNRVLVTLRLCAQTLERSDSASGAFFRRMKAKLGAPRAVTAGAHKLARIIYTMLQNKTQFCAPSADAYEQHHKQRQVKYLKHLAKKYGYTLQAAT